jgi:hypothetical protein
MNPASRLLVWWLEGAGVVNSGRRERVRISSGWSRRRRVKVKVNARWCCGGVCKNDVAVLERLSVKRLQRGQLTFFRARRRDNMSFSTSGDGGRWTGRADWALGCWARMLDP